MNVNTTIRIPIIPADVAEVIREEPDIHRTRKRGLAARYVDGSGVVWLMRAAVPATRAMVGEVIRTPEGRHRVHCWSTARADGRDPREIIAEDLDRLNYYSETRDTPFVGASLEDFSEDFT